MSFFWIWNEITTEQKSQFSNGLVRIWPTSLFHSDCLRFHSMLMWLLVTILDHWLHKHHDFIAKTQRQYTSPYTNSRSQEAPVYRYFIATCARAILMQPLRAEAPSIVNWHISSWDTCSLISYDNSCSCHTHCRTNLSSEECIFDLWNWDTGKPELHSKLWISQGVNHSLIDYQKFGKGRMVSRHPAMI